MKAKSYVYPKIQLRPQILDELSQEGPFELVMFKDPDKDTSIFLSSEYKHVLVVRRTLDPTLFLIMGFLTSQQENNVLITKYQPFSSSKEKAQFIHILVEPLIAHKKDLVPLSNVLLQDSTESIQSLGSKYISHEAVTKILNQLYSINVIPKLYNIEGLNCHDNAAITKEDLDYVLEVYHKKQKDRADYLFKIYDNIKIPRQKEKFFESMEREKTQNPLAYDLLNQMLKNNEK